MIVFYELRRILIVQMSRLETGDLPPILSCLALRIEIVETYSEREGSKVVRRAEDYEAGKYGRRKSAKEKRR